MISNASRENRQELLRRLHRGMENLRAKGEVEGIAWEVHKSMHLQEPDAQDIGRYLRAAKSGAEGGITSKIRTAAAQPYVDSILEVRTKPLPGGRFKREDEDVAATIENIMIQKPFVEGAAEKEFYSRDRTVAKSVSRLLVLHYEEEGGKRGLTLRLRSILPYLSAHLQAETLMAVENKFASPGKNLPKHSILEIHETLERLQKHKEEIVSANAKTILTAALNRGNLSLVDKLAEGAQEKYEELTKYKEEIVRINAKTIINAALNKGNLSLVDKLAEGAQEKYEELTKHKDKIVRANAKTIINAALRKGNLPLADTLAEGAQEKYEELTKYKEEELTKHKEIVSANAKTILTAALNRGNLSLVDKLAEGAQEKYEELTKHKDKIVRANAKTIIYAALRDGNLSLADTLAEGAKEKYEGLTKHKEEIVRINARRIISAALRDGNLSLADKFADEISKRPDNAREILRNYFSFNGE